MAVHQFGMIPMSDHIRRFIHKANKYVGLLTINLVELEDKKWQKVAHLLEERIA